MDATGRLMSQLSVAILSQMEALNAHDLSTADYANRGAYILPLQQPSALVIKCALVPVQRCLEIGAILNS